MKNKFFKRLVSGATSTAVASMFFLINAGGVSVNAASGDKFVVGNGTNQYKNTSEGYSYEVWIDNTGGTGSMTLGKGATFKAEWSAAVPQGNFLARRGLDFGSKQKATDYEYIGLDYDATYQQTNSGGNSRLCVYGWFENKGAAGNPPLVEYYIIEDWVNWRPTANGAAKTVTIDGADYEIFAIDHTGPTIHGGSETFKQYFSVRKDSRTSGHITVSDHFKAWADQGWGIGNLYEVSLNAEGWESSGVADVTMLDVYLDGGGAPQPTTTPTPAESDGNFFKSTFETGADNWSGRGDAKVTTDSKNYYAGNNSLLVSGRTDNWHGAAITLDPKTFIPGDSYSFSTAVLQKSGKATDMKLTLQYTLNGEENYDEVASATAKSGEWTKLENTSFKIPTGARNMVLYVEAPDSLTDFYLDEAQGTKAGTKSEVVTGKGTVEGAASQQPTTNPGQQTTAPSTPSGNIIYGDANEDGEVNIADATAIIQHLGNKDKYGLTEKGEENADCYEPGSGVTGADALAIQQLEAGMIDKLPIGDVKNPQVTTTAGGNGNTTTTAAGGNSSVSVDPTAYMDSVRKNMTNNVPASATKNNSNYGKLEDITYFSTTANRNKSAKVLLPDGYSTNEKYPVLYVNHGIFGDETSMLGMGVRDLAGNLMSSGEAEKMIIVFPNMFSSNTMAAPGNMDQSTFDGYDMFLDDLTKDLMPYIEKNYSVKTGRENTAISGFSMGGRESLYIGVSRPDLFGYIGAACPAPGVTPGVDSFANHPGNMSEADFRIKDTKNYPYLWIITGGTNDGVVGTFPQKYHQILTTNGQDHIWQEIQGGGHDSSCVTPMLYNFMKGIFKVNGGSSSSSSNTTPTPTVTTPAGGNYLTANFDSSTNNWQGRGDASVKLDSDNYYSGKSLAVSGRTDNWHGAALSLDSKTFVPGNSYSFSAAVLQKSGSTTGLSLTLQYSLNGKDNYDNIASVDAKSGEWTKLENTSFKIPAGATDMVLYFEAPDSLTDFYIDEVTVAAAGTKSSITTGKGTVKAGTTPVQQPVAGGVDTSWIDPTKPMVALSFDDGASPETGNRIVNALSKSGFHATFFYVANWINSAAGESEIKNAYSKGMEIANHTTSHPNLSEKSASEIRSEYDQCEAKLKGIIGAAPSKLLRLPYLASNNTVTSTLNDVPMITCAIDTQDWNGASKDDIIKKVLDAKNNGSLNGSIVLCHETYDSTASAIEYLAPYLKEQGWQIVTISEMFAVKNQQLKGGQIYTKAN